jgi:hypothetical protein
LRIFQNISIERVNYTPTQFYFAHYMVFSDVFDKGTES